MIWNLIPLFIVVIRRDLEGDQVMRAEPSEVELVPWKEDYKDVPQLSTKRGHGVMAMKQEAEVPQTITLTLDFPGSRIVLNKLLLFTIEI